MNDISTTSFSSFPALINVFGTSGIGKTATLAVLYDLVIVSPVFQKIAYRQYNQFDFSAIFDYNGTRVGIMTMGDPGCEVEVQDFLDECKRHSCERIFTASRSRGSIFGLVINFAASAGYAFIETSPLNMRFLNKNSGSSAFLHKAFAKMLVNLI